MAPRSIGAGSWMRAAFACAVWLCVGEVAPSLAAQQEAQQPSPQQEPQQPSGSPKPAQPAAATSPTPVSGDSGTRPPFSTVLWVPAERAADPARLAAVRNLGFDAINLGPQGDPAPLRAAGLGYYLDQPIGKGFLELRDAEWKPIADAYERTRDADALARPQCLRDEAKLAELGTRATAAVTRLAGPGLRFVALADEASSTRHCNPLDVCRCARCIDAFRVFARARHGTIDALNEAWGTQFESFDVVSPLTTDQVRRRELGGVLLPARLEPFSDWLEFVDMGFANAVRRLAQDAARGAGGAPVGLTGVQAPLAFGGHDYFRLLSGSTLVEAYDLGGAVDLARSAAPRAQRWSTLMVPLEVDASTSSVLLARLSEAAQRGDSGTVVWNDERVLSAEGAPNDAGRALRQAMQAARPVLDACAGADVKAHSVWMCESRASVRAWWMLDSEADGMTWVRRLSSHEITHSTSAAARRGWRKLLGDVGVTPQFVSEDELPTRLLQENPKLLVLPATIALSDRACRAIAAYVQQGGALVADHSPALYDERLRLRESGGLDALFGIEKRSLRLEDLGVREGRMRTGRIGAVDRGLRAKIAERTGSESVYVEQRHRRGRAICLNLPVCVYAGVRLDPASVDVASDLRRRVRQAMQALQLGPMVEVRGEGLPTCVHRTWLDAAGGARRILAVRLDAIDAPDVLAQLGQKGPRRVRLLFPQPVRVLSLGGAEIGSGTEIEADLDVYAGLFVEVRR